jgi:ketosteroid isomerase-like protein
MKISRFAAGSPFSLLALAGFCAATAVAGGNADSLAAAEKAFAEEAQSKGVRTAFLNVLANDAIIFEPGPQNGLKAWQAKKAFEGILKWQPVLAGTATNGDLGYTTGPYSLQEKDQKSTSFGQFVSIWRWQSGKWKLIFDISSDNPAPTEPPPELFLADNHAPHEEPAIALPVMMAEDQAYAADRVGKMPALAEENVRLYLPYNFPIMERSAATAALVRVPGKMTFHSAKGVVSTGGDFGYVWGEYSADPATDARGDYLRIWRKNRTGTWRLALDLTHPR